MFIRQTGRFRLLLKKIVPCFAQHCNDNLTFNDTLLYLVNPLDASPRTLYVVIFELPYASPRTAYVVVWNKKSENIPWAETFETSPAWRSKHVVKPVLPLIMCNVKLSRYEFLFEGVCCKTSFIVYFKKNENLFFCLSKFTEKKQTSQRNINNVCFGKTASIALSNDTEIWQSYLSSMSRVIPLWNHHCLYAKIVVYGNF